MYHFLSLTFSMKMKGLTRLSELPKKGSNISMRLKLFVDFILRRKGDEAEDILHLGQVDFEFFCD